MWLNAITYKCNLDQLFILMFFFFFFSQKMVVQLNRRLSVEQNNKCIQLFIRNRKDTSLIAYVNIVSATTFFVHNGVSQIIMILEMRKSL